MNTRVSVGGQVLSSGAPFCNLWNSSLGSGAISVLAALGAIRGNARQLPDAERIRDAWPTCPPGSLSRTYRKALTPND
jgi:hypothetical protein